MNYTTIFKDDYERNRAEILDEIRNLIKNDSSKIANIAEITNHLDFIFKWNNSILVFLFIDNTLVSMVNSYEYDWEAHEWCVFSLFTKGV